MSPSGPPPITAIDIALARIGILESVHGAGQRLSQRRMLQRHVVRHDERVLGDDALGNADELGVSAVVEEQIVAEILLAAQAEIALAARRGVERDDAVAGREIRDSLARFDDRSRQLVAEERGRHDHARVIAAAKDFEIGAAGERRAHANDQFAGGGLGNGNLLDADIFAAVKDGGAHGAAPVEKRVLDGPAALADSGLDRLAAFDDDRLDGIQACLDDRLDGIQAAFDDVLDLFCGPLRRRSRRSCGRGGSRLSPCSPSDSPYSAPAPGTGSIIIFIEPGWGCDAISMAATASSNGKRCEISWVRSKPLR